MSRHILQLEVPDVYNEGIFIVKDTSIYTSSLGVSCPSLQITPPGFSTPTVITPTSHNFEMILNACTLGITSPTNCATSCPNIPDGIYGIYYTVAPNDQVYVGYQYLRIVSAINRLNGLLCDLGLPCCLPDQEIEDQLKNISIIRGYLISAQTNVNTQKEYTDGINQYRYAISLMDKMTHRKPKCVRH
jgi:hypothetical protein